MGRPLGARQARGGRVWRGQGPGWSWAGQGMGATLEWGRPWSGGDLDKSEAHIHRTNCPLGQTRSHTALKPPPHTHTPTRTHTCIHIPTYACTHTHTSYLSPPPPPRPPPLTCDLSSLRSPIRLHRISMRPTTRLMSAVGTCIGGGTHMPSIRVCAKALGVTPTFTAWRCTTSHHHNLFHYHHYHRHRHLIKTAIMTN